MSKQDRPIGFQRLKLVLNVALLFAVVFVECANFRLGLNIIWPTKSGDNNVHTTSAVLTIAPVLGLMVAEILLRQGRENFTLWFSRLLVRFGVLSVFLLIIGGMIFLPSAVFTSLGVAGGAKQGSGFALGIMLSSLLPISIFGNHTIINWIIASYREIEDVLNLRSEIGHIRLLNSRIQSNRAGAADIDDKLAALPTDDEVTDSAATDANADVGIHLSLVERIIAVREALKTPGDDGKRNVLDPQIEREFSDLLAIPLQRLIEMRDRLQAVTKQSIIAAMKA